MVAISDLFSLLGSPKSKLLILQTGAECSGSPLERNRSLISEHVSTEALLAAESQRQTPLGAALRRAAKSGGAPADETVLAVLRRWYFARRVDSGFRLDGFPRTNLQALVFDEWLEARGESLDACLCLARTSCAETPVASYYRQRGLLLEMNEGDVQSLFRS